MKLVESMKSRVQTIKKLTITNLTMIKEQYKYSELTSKIIGILMEVHKILGNGFQEVILSIGIRKRNGFASLQKAFSGELKTKKL
jgi:hypothetical protein